MKISEFVRQNVESFIGNKEFPEYSEESTPENLPERRGAFVRIKDPATGEVLGEEGHLTADRPFHILARDLAISILNNGNMRAPGKDIAIEIFAVRNLRAARDLSVIDPEKHGIMIQILNRQSFRLPAPVHAKTKKDPGEYLRSLCAASGIRADIENCLVFTFEIEAVE